MLSRRLLGQFRVGSSMVLMLAATVGCGSTPTMPNPPPAPPPPPATPTSIRVSLSFIGTGTDPNGIRVTRRRGGSQTTSQLTTATPVEWFVSPGSHQVTIEDIAPHCALWGSFPSGPRVDATVAASTTLNIEITLACFGDVFYELEFGLQVVSADGVGTTLPFDGQPGGWSVDGTRFLWSARPLGNDDLYVFDVASGVETRITNDPADEYQPSWSPNGSQIVFIRDVLGTSDLVRINADGSGEVILTDGNHHRDPVWSPDGTRIAFERNNDIYVIDADGSNLQPLVADSDAALQPQWSADGAWVYYRRFGSQIEPWIVREDGSDDRLLSDTAVASCRWAPSGSRIVCVDRPGGFNIGSSLYDVDGNVIRQFEMQNVRWFPGEDWVIGTEVPGLGTAFRVLRLSDDREIRLLTEERRAFPRPSPAAVAR